MRFLFLCLLLWTNAAQAHFLTGAESREIHVETDPDDGETMILMRFPLTFAYVAALASRQAPDDVVNSPFLAVEHVAGTPFYRLDQTAYEEDFEGFTQFLLKDYRFSFEGQEVTPMIGAVSLMSRKDTEMPGRGLAAAQALLDMCAEVPGKDYLSDIEVAMQLYLPDVFPDDALTITVTTPKVALPPTLLFDTHVTDHRHAPPLLITHEGFLPPTIELTGRASQSFAHWVVQGGEHILFGFDHVLFVLCLALAAQSLRGLLWSVTGFTLGHSVTLSAGVLGLVPDAGWFIPLVELGVALSIAFMAVLVIARRSGPMSFGLAAVLGLLHGFGFAFMLTPLLDGASPALPLAGFNIGVELGQILIVALVFVALLFITRANTNVAHWMRYGLALFALVISLQMAFERTGLVMAEISENTHHKEGV